MSGRAATSRPGFPCTTRSLRYYEEETNILVSDLGTADATVRMTTFMPYPRSSVPLLVRLVSSKGLPIDVTMEFFPAFRYGEEEPVLTAEGNGVVARGESKTLRLFCTAEPEVTGQRAETTIRFGDGDVHAFVLAYGHRAECPDPRRYAKQLLAATRTYWREWSCRCTHTGEHRPDVLRSLLTLKLLQYQPTGTFVAAPSLGLPEQPGGKRNWDYRYVWLRDGVFIVMAFESTGYTEEADAFRWWLASLLRRDPPERLQPLYRVDLGREVEERDLDRAEGYRHSTPVHIGNGAGRQFQLDTFGEVMLCFHRAPRLMQGPEGPAIWEALRRLVDWVCENWRRPDAGIWEIRGGNYQQIFSKAMAYMAVRRGIEIATENGFPAPLERWERVRDDIWSYVDTEGYSAEVGAYTQMTVRNDADVAMLLFPIVGVTEYGHERFAGTVRYIEDQLDEEGYLQRYIIDDNLQGREGAFLPACFWMATVKANQGDIESARDWYARAYRAASPLGLFSEEIDGVGRVMLGNFPQALTHLSHVLAAWAIDHPGEEKNTRAGPAAAAAVRLARRSSSAGRAVGRYLWLFAPSPRDRGNRHLYRRRSR